MNTGLKVGLFASAIAFVFGSAVIVGWAAGPIDDEPESHDASHSGGASEAESGAHQHGATPAANAASAPAGLSISDQGYTLALDAAHAEPGTSREIAFRITGPQGDPVTEFEVAHEKELHLIVVRRDLTGFQHVHPTRDDDGTWRVDVDLTPGTWRVFADFQATGGPALTLGADLHVPGQTEHVVTEPNRVAQVGDYEVTLNGDLAAGQGAMLTLSVAKDGEPVTDLEPYLGAYGHLVALRAGDLAYLHAHPEGDPSDPATPSGPEVGFHVTAPSAGRYHLYLDFQHDGVVRTAAFVLDVGTGAASGSGDHSEHGMTPSSTEEESGDEHQH
ncbi:hypothetical protein NODU109028_08865 [Nocardioides dubius]|uniref:Heavy-metal-associated domain-containing protein n=1 Tax=Nocardioides dubius TaxID=317019 RepID=A0ABN1TWY6_9ACTN